MAQETGTFATNDMVGIREDLTDAIYNISPVETPFLSSVAHTTASNVLHEWQTDALSAAADNKAIEGAAAPNTAGTATTRLTNRTQIATLDARVSGTARSVTTAGRSDELDYQLLKRGKELKNGMEKTLLSNKPKVTGDDTTAAELAGIGAWITTNDDFASDGGSPTAATGVDARTDGTQRAFTEDQLKTVCGDIYTAGGNPNVLMVGGFNRQVASSFSAGRTNMQKAEDKVLHASFDVYESDFSRLKIVPNRFQRARDALVLQTSMWAIPFLPGRNMVTFDIAKTGDTDAKQILSEFTLEARNEAANGGVFDLTTS